MAEPFLGETRIFSFEFAPKGWALCNGQLLPINQNQALFSLLGTTYGGDGRTTFALPDLRGRVPIHAGNGFFLGANGGEASSTLTLQSLPAHTHMVRVSGDVAKLQLPTNGVLAQAPINVYSNSTLDGSVETLNAMNPAASTAIGGSQPHENMQPYLTLNVCIALQGIFPSPN